MSDDNKNPIRIVIFDNHALVRAGIRLLIDRIPGIQVVGESGNLSEGLEIIASQNPDVILLELNLVGQTEFDIVPCLVKGSERARLILVTGISDSQILHKAIEDGVMGVVFKTQPPETLIKSIQKVYAGEAWLERSMIANVLNRRTRNHTPIDPEKDSIAQLSEREKQVIRLIGQGYKNKKISTQLCISETTVRHHLTSIYSKLGVSDRLELLVFAHRNDLVNPTDI
jgi:two-component system, NarL family, nitrate/nitrite response regulator NarL